MADSQNAPIVKKPASSEESVTKELIVAEYNNLYTEMLKRLDIRYQTTQFALTGLGVFLTVGLSAKIATLIYIYPAFVLVLSIAYVTNTVELGRIKRYIASYIEPRVGNAEGEEEQFGWMRHEEEEFSRGPFKLISLGHLGTQLPLFLSAVAAVVIGKLAALFYGGDNTTFFWFACIVTVLEGILLFVVEWRLSSFFQ